MAKEEKKETKNTAKAKQPKAELPDTCVVVLEKSTQDFGIDHLGRQSIVAGEFSQGFPSTFIIRTDEKQELRAIKQVYAMGTKSADKEVGLVHAKSPVQAVVMIAQHNQIKKISVAPGESQLAIRGALEKMVLSLGVSIQVD